MSYVSGGKLGGLMLCVVWVGACAAPVGSVDEDVIKAATTELQGYYHSLTTDSAGNRMLCAARVGHLEERDDGYEWPSTIGCTDYEGIYIERGVTFWASRSAYDEAWLWSDFQVVFGAESVRDASFSFDTFLRGGTQLFLTLGDDWGPLSGNRLQLEAWKGELVPMGELTGSVYVDRQRSACTARFEAQSLESAEVSLRCGEAEAPTLDLHGDLRPNPAFEDIDIHAHLLGKVSRTLHFIADFGDARAKVAFDFNAYAPRFDAEEPLEKTIARPVQVIFTPDGADGIQLIGSMATAEAWAAQED